MHITFSPQHRTAQLELTKIGDVLTLNGEALDLSSIPEGATVPAGAIDSDWVTGPVMRTNGALHLTLVLPHGQNAPHETRFPQPISVIDDGSIVLPPYSEPTEETET
ncbi:MAG: hypothetical protein JXR13_18775 [Thalassovita sp.]